MDTLPVPHAMAASAAAASGAMQCSAEEEVPLGWECAYPALQIDCWGAEDTSSDLSGKS